MSQFFSHPTAPPTPSPHPSDPPLLAPKVARNSATRKFGTAHKRCNSNGPVSTFERFTWELRATFFGNHAQRCQRCPDTPSQLHVAPPSRRPPPRPRHAQAPTPPKSHVIRLPENSAPPTNVAIPTVRFQHLKGLHGNCMRHFSATTPNGANGARTRQHMPTQLHVTPNPEPPPHPGLVASARHPAPASSRAPAPASSRASTHTPAQ